MTSLTILDRNRRPSAALVLAVVATVTALTLPTASGQTAGQLPSARWIPTDLNYALISHLRANDLQSPIQQIQGYATLGIIPVDVVGSWITALIQNPNYREGTVRWNPGVPTKCGYNRTGCTKSIKVSVLEFNFVRQDALDCLAYGLVAADAILPQQSLLADTNGATFQPSGPINYEIVAAPNATNGSCTYIVQYPQNTQALANQLCDANCFNSPCQPCNANQTITGPDITTNCLPTSGIAPTLVAAIQGAGQCLAVGPVGRFQCQIKANTSTCAQMACFPGDASVTVRGGQTKQMRELQLGDSVRVVKPNGALAWDEVYFFGHREEKAMAKFVRLSLKAESQQRFIELSAKHFIPASRSSSAWQSARQLRARDVQPGDLVWVESGVGVQPFEVVAKEDVIKSGLWAPYTASGTIVVDGVAASVHSEWYLDGIFEAIGRQDLLPRLYQALLFPIRLLYKLLGSAAMRKLDVWLRIEDLFVPSAAAATAPLPLKAAAAIAGIAGVYLIPKKLF